MVRTSGPSNLVLVPPEPQCDEKHDTMNSKLNLALDLARIHQGRHRKVLEKGNNEEEQIYFHEN